MFKKTQIAALIVAVSTLSATAGGISEPVMEPQIIIQDVQTSSGGNGLLQWTILALAIVALSAN